MGAIFREFCHADAAAAAAALCGAEYPRTDLDGAGNARVVSCVPATDGASVQLLAQVPSTATSASTSVPVAFGACNPDEHYEDLAAIWGLGLVCVCLIWIAAGPFVALGRNQ